MLKHWNTASSNCEGGDINASTPGIQFPEGFVFGVATAAYQIEGAVNEDGRGPSIWDTFSHNTKGVRNGDNGDIACDHYHRWEADLDLIASLGVDAYRFSIAWPRLFPTGDGPLNEAGLDFYNRLIDGCVKRNLKVFVTLFHWDLPQALADKGGWANRHTADCFARFASTVAHRLGDRIDTVCTFNEPWCSSVLSNLWGVHAPGKRDLDHTLAVIHGQHRAHGLAIKAVREQRPALPAGIVLNPHAIRPFTDSAADRAAAKRHWQFHNGLFLDPLFNGHYPQAVIDALGDRFPENWQDDMTTIHQPLDFWGVNYYTPEYVTDSIKKDAPYPATTTASRQNVQRTDIGWEIDASALAEMLDSLYANYTLPLCYITENGAAYNHGEINGIVDDQPRIDYLLAHLQTVHSLISKGLPIKGYFAWSLMDNFEWAEGYEMRFGLIHVNYETQKRTLKNSAIWFQRLLAEQHQ